MLGVGGEMVALVLGVMGSLSQLSVSFQRASERLSRIERSGDKE